MNVLFLIQYVTSHFQDCESNASGGTTVYECNLTAKWHETEPATLYLHLHLFLSGPLQRAHFCALQIVVCSTHGTSSVMLHTLFMAALTQCTNTHTHTHTHTHIN